jgi:hypothetical protein
MFDSTVVGASEFPALLARQMLEDRDTEDVAPLKKGRTICAVKNSVFGKMRPQKKL